jgi:hypothetical protein
MSFCNYNTMMGSLNNNSINHMGCQKPNVKKWVNFYAAKILITYYDMDTDITYTKCFPISMKQDLYNMGII